MPGRRAACRGHRGRGRLAPRAAAGEGAAVAPLGRRRHRGPRVRHRAPEAELGWKPRVELDDAMPAVGAWLAGQRTKRAAARMGLSEPSADDRFGFDWRGYLDDPDEGLGTVFERFRLDTVLERAIEQTGATSVLHAPLFGMMGIPGLDAVFCARRGLRVGLLDTSEERLESVRAMWRDLGLEPEVHLVDGPDPATWPERLSVPYDLVFSFAALWWYPDPWAVVQAQMRWADRGGARVRAASQRLPQAARQPVAPPALRPPQRGGARPRRARRRGHDRRLAARSTPACSTSRRSPTRRSRSRSCSEARAATPVTARPRGAGRSSRTCRATSPTSSSASGSWSRSRSGCRGWWRPDGRTTATRC